MTCYCTQEFSEIKMGNVCLSTKPIRGGLQKKSNSNHSHRQTRKERHSDGTLEIFEKKFLHRCH